MNGGWGWLSNLTYKVTMVENKDSLTDVINNSGFLFQLRLEEEIKKTRPLSPMGEWQQIAREHKWIDTLDGKEGFIDIVLESGDTTSLLLAGCYAR